MVGSSHPEYYPLPYRALILNGNSEALPFTCSWDPTPSAELSVGNPGSFPAFWNYSSDDDNGEDD